MRTAFAGLADALIVAVAVAIALLRFVAIDAASHSASDTLRPWLLEVAVIAALAVGSLLIVGRWSRKAR